MPPPPQASNTHGGAASVLFSAPQCFLKDAHAHTWLHLIQHLCSQQCEWLISLHVTCKASLKNPSPQPWLSHPYCSITFLCPPTLPRLSSNVLWMINSDIHQLFYSLGIVKTWNRWLADNDTDKITGNGVDNVEYRAKMYTLWRFMYFLTKLTPRPCAYWLYLPCLPS